MSGNSSSSSRRGKKNSGHSSDKPKQPQRGLGVAQLEKIRLHSQMEEMKIQAYAAMQPSIGVGVPPTPHFGYQSNSSPYGYPSQMMMGYGDMERSNLRYGESQSCHQPRWNPSQAFPDTHTYGQPSIPTRHFLETSEDPEQSMSRNYWLSMNGSSSHNPGSSDSQDLDLELRL